jgi:hypothetical protein
MSLILHGKEVHNDQKWQTLVSLPFTLPNVLALLVAEKVLWAVGSWCCGERIDQSMPCVVMLSTWQCSFWLHSSIWQYMNVYISQLFP